MLSKSASIAIAVVLIVLVIIFIIAYCYYPSSGCETICHGDSKAAKCALENRKCKKRDDSPGTDNSQWEEWKELRRSKSAATTADRS